ncbi:GNAT family N-acetyltransferase [Clostridium sp. JNZ X4-2]
MEEWNFFFSEYTTLLAVQAGVIGGFADMDGNGYLDRLFVYKDYQSVGIAAGLVKKLERRVGKNNVVCFETYASITVRPFLEQLGYVMQTENTVVREDVSLTNLRMTKVVSDY